MGSQGDERRAERAADLYAEYRVRVDEGEDMTLDELIAANPLFADELRALDRDERRLARLTGSLGMGFPAGASHEPAMGTSHAESIATDAPPPAAAAPSAPEAPARPARRASDLIDTIAARDNPFVRYRIERKIGQGSMGEVFRVWDQDLRRSLAMKVLSRGLAHGGEADRERTLTRFIAEAQVTSQLDHPCIVPVHDFGVSPEGQAYFTMKIVKGRELLQVIEELHAPGAEDGDGEWTQTRVLGLMQKVCEAMAYAHHKGVLHRDLKPTNIMVGRYGAIYVMDWGLNRVLEGSYRDVVLDDGDITMRVTSDREALIRESTGDMNRTRKGASVGTPFYMSPEQAAGRAEAIDQRTDVYGVGAILYHLVSGHAPYSEPGRRIAVEAVLFRVQQGPPHSIDTVAPDAPPELRAIIRKAMAHSAGNRFQTMEQLAREIDAYLTAGGDSARQAPVPPKLLWAGGAALALAGAAIGYALS